MPHKSPFTDWVAEAWDDLVLDKGAQLSLDERRRRWSELYERTYINGAWVVNVEDAGLVSSLGDELAMMNGEFAVARDLLRQFFAHPQIDSVEEYVHFTLFVREAIADILCGNVDSAIDRLQMGIREPKDGGHFVVLVRNELINLVNEFGLTNECDPRIAEFVSEVVGCFKGLKRFAPTVSNCRTYGELNDALFRTYVNGTSRPRVKSKSQL